MSARLRLMRARTAQIAADHPRHVVLAAAVLGLLTGPRMPPEALAATAVAVSMAAVRVPLVRHAPMALGLSAVLLIAAVGSNARAGALEHTLLGPEFGHAVSGEATVLTAPRDDAFGGRRTLVRWHGEAVLLRLGAWDRSEPPRVGDVVAVRGTLREPDRTARTARAHAVLRAGIVTATGRRRGGALGLIDGVRRRAEAALAADLPRPEAGLLRGMVLGQDDALPGDVRDAFRAAGLSHLVAASGQNIMLLAALVVGLCALAGIGVRERWCLVLGLIALYVPLAGAGPSIQRAGIMGAATVAAALAGRPASRCYALLLAAAATLALDPRAAEDAGWQLSFAAVVGIAVLARPAAGRLRRAGLPGAAAEVVAVTIAATLATAPIIAWRFDRTSIVGLPANVLAAPAVAPIMWLGMLAAAVGQLGSQIAAPLVAVASLPLGYLVALGRAAAALPGAQVAVPAVAVTALAALVGLALLPSRSGAADRDQRRRMRRRAGVALLTVVGAACLLGPLAARRSSVAPPPAGDLRITALDIGQGDATLIQADGHAVLVDAGPPAGAVVDELERAGVRRLDALVVSHAQLDHEGGAPAVLDRMPVDLLLDGRSGDRAPASAALDAPLRRRGTRVMAARAGQELRAGRLQLRVLWPPPGPPVPGGDPNDRAVVAVATAYGASALLTADAESPVLARLDVGPVDVLKVSHHGSADAGLPALLQRLRPRVALVEVGRHNTYGHPTATTMQALASVVPSVRRTDLDGTVRVDLQGGRASVATSGGQGSAGV